VSHDPLGKHDQRLQSLRGLAALTVVVGHCLVTFKNGRIEEPAFHLAPSNALLAGLQVTVHANSAVVFFYVLSGLVLGESLRRSGMASLGQLGCFVVRRVFRLYPIAILSVLFAAAVLRLNAGTVVPGMTTTMDGAMHTPFGGLWALVRNLLCIDYDINPLLWSVQVEVVMIAVLPPLYVLSSRLPLAVNVAVFVSLLLLSILLWVLLPNPARYFHCFYLGLILPQLIAAPWLRKIFCMPLILSVALVITVPVEWLYVSNRLWLPYKFATDAVVSAAILGFVLSRPVTWLRAGPLVFLGDISFSLYALSMAVQFAIIGLVFPRFISAAPSNNAATVSEALLMVGTIVVVLPLSTACYVLIERPAIARGRDFIRWLSTRHAILSRIAQAQSRPL
jgi:peptidoglycan/LPS O-acetylase OafA/YrhL